jgi:hypothetical protein
MSPVLCIISIGIIGKVIISIVIISKDIISIVMSVHRDLRMCHIGWRGTTEKILENEVFQIPPDTPI